MKFLVDENLAPGCRLLTAAGVLIDALPAAIAQTLLSFADAPRESEQALGWVDRIEAADRRLA